MTGSELSLAVLVAAVSVGEQAYLGADRRTWRRDTGYALAYALLAWAVTGSPVAALITVAVGLGLRRVAASRQVPSPLAAALASLAAPYLAVGLGWALGQTGRPGPATALLAGAWSRIPGAGAGDPSNLAHGLLVLAAYAVCWRTATVLTRALLGGYAPHLAPAAPLISGLAEAAAATDPEDLGLARAGRLIGHLERFLVLTLALTGNDTAIGFVVAAKSIARFDLARRHGEYFLIGTLTSIGFALGAGMVVRLVIGA